MVISNLTRQNVRSLVRSNIHTLQGDDQVREWDFSTGAILPDITFTRASSGTYFDNNGILRTASNNQTRINSLQDGSGLRGLLIEESRVNLCTNYSDPTDLTNVSLAGDAAATLTLVDDSTALAAAGLAAVVSTDNVYRLDNTGGSGNAWVDVTGDASSGIEHTWSAYVRGSGDGQLRWSGAGTVVVAFTGTANYVRVVGQETPPDGNRRMNVNANAGSVVYFTLAQLEVGGFETSEILVAGSSATRAADVCTIENIDQVDWFNVDEGTTVMDFLTIGWSENFQTLFSLGNGSASNSVGLRVRGDTEALEANIVATTTQTSITLESPITHLESKKVAFAYKANDAAACLDGGAVTSDNSVTLPPMTNLYIGDVGNGTRYANGIITKISYYPTRLSNDLLQDLTR